eukprot:6456626-Prorocentrum_lima.AAC.1
MTSSLVGSEMCIRDSFVAGTEEVGARVRAVHGGGKLAHPTPQEQQWQGGQHYLCCGGWAIYK